ncbi:LytTR family DNA-binding domain-containing protein [Pontibacter sp. G13]|uniref:LytR/AlgR family response regulator transcription factor n=1 Tax=Pontibacter sp. G13 TaxID=3074898 RepID=UPI00288980B9|nr:LytTR family DNA-binding domain-containing protein [Pontibacter sp. G13]WNJ18114.1 LytTR family DNA-binding domain-containing protein [Pontibacter sp. G13]
MKIVIIEDEPTAARRLEKLVNQLAPEIEVLASLDSVESSVSWLQANAQPDAMMLDIQLADGDSFEIFREVDIQCPVIFTTAFDEHALKAFKHNGIDYLLKPIKKEELSDALGKLQAWTPGDQSPADTYKALLDALPAKDQAFQKRLVIRFGQHIKAIEVSEVAYFYIESKVTILRTFEGRDFPVDQNLDQLEQILDPAKFFRINRKCIVNVEAIDQMYTYSKSRVKLTLNPAFSEETIVSSERSPKFKIWLKG